MSSLGQTAGMSKNRHSSEMKQKIRSYQFQPEWEEEVFFTCMNRRCMCLICHRVFTLPKKCNLSRHLRKQHSSYEKRYPLGSQERTRKVKELKKALALGRPINSKPQVAEQGKQQKTPLKANTPNHNEDAEEPNEKSSDAFKPHTVVDDDDDDVEPDDDEETVLYHTNSMQIPSSPHPAVLKEYSYVNGFYDYIDPVDEMDAEDEDEHSQLPDMAAAANQMLMNRTESANPSDTLEWQQQVIETQYQIIELQQQALIENQKHHVQMMKENRMLHYQLLQHLEEQHHQMMGVMQQLVDIHMQRVRFKRQTWN